MPAQRIQLLGSVDCIISGAAHDITMISCTGVSGNSTMSGRTYIENGRVLGNKWNELNYLNASALAPFTLDGTSGRYYEVDTSVGDCYMTFDATALEGEIVELNFPTEGNNLYISTTDNAGTFIGETLPYTFTPIQWESLTLGFKDGNIKII
jgi:hypothetical protein